MAKRTDLDELEEWEDLLLLKPREDYDDAIIGVIHQGGFRAALYSRAKCIEINERFAREDAPDKEDPEGEAIEMYDFNTSGSMGNGYPWFLLDDTVLVTVEKAEEE